MTCVTPASAAALLLTVATGSPCRWPSRARRRPSSAPPRSRRRHLRDQRPGQRRRLPGRHPLPRRQLHRRSRGRPATGWPPATPPPGACSPGTPTPTASSGPSRSPPPGPGCTWAGTSPRIGGAVRARVAALSPTSGGAFGWSPYVNDSVKAVTTSNSGATVYVGGDFDSAEGAGRQHLAAFNATSGNSPPPSSRASPTAPATSPRCCPWTSPPTTRPSTSAATSPWSTASRAATRPPVSTGIATLRAWSPASTADIAAELTVSASGNTVFVGGRSTGGYVQAYGPTPAAPRSGTWPPTATSRPWPSPPRSCTWAATSPPSAASARGHLAALRASGGACESWNPGANGVFGAFGAAITSSRVAFGGEFTQAGGEAHQGLVQFSGTP